jgi:putative phosphoesterase
MIPTDATLRIGVISDTHGLLRPQARALLTGCDGIIHAGDIGHAGILEALAALAPLYAVRGNNDTGGWADALPEYRSIRLGRVLVHVVHDLACLGIVPPDAGIRVVICGHSHRPGVQERNGVLYLNPGSAGRRRFKLPVTMAELTIAGAAVAARIVECGEEIVASRLPPP